MTAGFVVAKRVTAELEITRIENRLFRAPLAVGKRSECHVRFEGRAWGVSSGQRAIDQRMIQRGVKFIPILRINAVYKQVWVKTRLGYQRQHAAGSRFDRDQRTAVVAERA